MYKAILSSVILFVSLHANAELLLTAKEDILIQAKATSTNIGGGCVMTHDSNSDVRKLRTGSVINVTSAEHVRPILRDAAVDYLALTVDEASKVKSYEQLEVMAEEMGIKLPLSQYLLEDHNEFENVVSSTIAMLGGDYKPRSIKTYLEYVAELQNLGSFASANKMVDSYTKLILHGKSKKSDKLIVVECTSGTPDLHMGLMEMTAGSQLDVINTPDDL